MEHEGKEGEDRTKNGQHWEGKRQGERELQWAYEDNIFESEMIYVVQ